MSNPVSSFEKVRLSFVTDKAGYSSSLLDVNLWAAEAHLFQVSQVCCTSRKVSLVAQSYFTLGLGVCVISQKSLVVQSYSTLGFQDLLHVALFLSSRPQYQRISIVFKAILTLPTFTDQVEDITWRWNRYQRLPRDG